MTSAARRILFRAALTTLAAVVLTGSLLLVERAIIGVPLSDLDIIEAILLPIAVGMPIALFIFIQSEKLRRAYSDLAALHRETARARDLIKQSSEEIRYAATHDGMTNLVNRTYFLEELSQSFERGSGDVLLIADVDHFKSINDDYGHLKGDEALTGIAAALRSAVREGDVVGRVGGEEFGILLRNVSVAQAADVAELMRRRVEQIPWPRRLSISIGGAAFVDHPAGALEVFAQADRQLYRAKRAGRNCIAFHTVLSDVASAMARHSGQPSTRGGSLPAGGSAVASMG